MQLYFRYESAGECRRKFLSSGEKCFANVCTKGHRIVKNGTTKGTSSYEFEETRSGSKNTPWKNSETTSDASFQQLTENSRQQTTTSAVLLSAFGLEGNLCRVCFSTGEFLLDFQRVTSQYFASFPHGLLSFLRLGVVRNTRATMGGRISAGGGDFVSAICCRYEVARWIVDAEVFLTDVQLYLSMSNIFRCEVYKKSTSFAQWTSSSWY